MAVLETGGVSLSHPPPSDPGDRNVASTETMAEGAALAPADTGRVIITSVPADARVTIDGREYGSTPLTVDDLAAGSYTLLLESRVGAVRRTMTIHPGETTTVSEPIYAGWIAVFSPVRLEIFERGRPIGTSEDGRIMVSPGTHELLLINERFAYRSVLTLDVGPGDVAAHTIELPTGVVTIRAEPWAEIIIDGEPVGRTPLESIDVPIGTRQIGFTHPDLGDKRAILTVTLAAPLDLHMDMSR